MNRRGFLELLGAAVATAVVRPSASVVRYVAPRLGLATPAWARFDEIVTATLRNHAAELADNATRANALLRRMDAVNEIEHLRARDTIPISISDEMVDRALNAWFASPPSETDQGLERSMKAAIESALLRDGGRL